MNGYPIQPAKVQRPRCATRRSPATGCSTGSPPRSTSGSILVLADAGYGKTTLLADFSRRTTAAHALVSARRGRSRLDLVPEPPRRRRPRARSRRSRRRPAAMLSDLAMGGPTREAATEVFLRELPSITEQGAVLILDDFHLVDESPDVRLIVRELVARAPERLSIVFASRRAPTRPAGPAARVGRGRRDRDGRPALRRHRDRPAVHRDVRAGARAGRPRRRRRADRRLGRVAPARPGRAPRPIAGRDPAIRPRLERRRSGALRLPRRGGRRRPARGSPAVPHADVDPPDRDGRPGGRRDRPRSRRRRAADGRRRASDAADPTEPDQPRPAALPPARPRVPRGSPATVIERGRGRRAPPPRRRVAADHDWRVAAYHFREAGDHTAVADTIAAAIPEIMGSGQHATADDEIDRRPRGPRPPVLGVWSRRGSRCSEGTTTAQSRISQRSPRERRTRVAERATTRS